MVFQNELSLSTTGHGDLTDITLLVQAIVEDARIEHGIAHVFNVGSTAAISTIEFEPGLERDLPEILNELIPPGTEYGHEEAWADGNAHSHLQATILGPGLSIPISQNQLVLGTWQQIVHIECDNKPRKRRVVVTVMGE